MFSPSINKEIELIDEFNQPLGDSLYEWYDYIDGIIDYLSYAKIAFDVGWSLDDAIKSGRIVNAEEYINNLKVMCKH